MQQWLNPRGSKGEEKKEERRKKKKKKRPKD